MQDISLNPCNLCLYYGMENRPHTTNSERYNLSLRSNNYKQKTEKGVSNTMKLTMKQARVLISNQLGVDRAIGMSPTEVNEYTETELGMSTATPRVNKMAHAPAEVKSAWDVFEASLTTENYEIWNANLSEEGTTISEVTANCKA